MSRQAAASYLNHWSKNNMAADPQTPPKSPRPLPGGRSAAFAAAAAAFQAKEQQQQQRPVSPPRSLSRTTTIRSNYSKGAGSILTRQASNSTIVSQSGGSSVGQTASQSPTPSVDQSASHPASHPVSHPVNHLTNQPVSHATSQPNSQSISQSISQPTSQSTSQPTSQLTNQPATQSAPPPLAGNASNTIIIFIASVSPPALQIYLNTLLARSLINEITVIATNDETLKLARMDIYTCAGKLRQDILVTTHKIAPELAANDIITAVKASEGKRVCGVVCCLDGVGSTALKGEKDILDYDEAELEASWRTAVLLPHTLARATFPFLQQSLASYSLTSSSQSPAPAYSQPHGTDRPFFYLDPPSSSSSNSLTSPSSPSSDPFILTALASSPKAQNITIALVKPSLIPPPTPPPAPVPAVPARKPIAIDTSGAQHANGGSYYTYGAQNGAAGTNGTAGNGYGGVYGDDVESPGLAESPTKLWASWAMMNE